MEHFEYFDKRMIISLLSILFKIIKSISIDNTEKEEHNVVSKV